MIDINEVKRIKERLQESPNNFPAIIESTYMAVCVTDKEGNVLAVNDNFCLLFGYAPEEVAGNSFTVIVPEYDRDVLLKYHKMFFQNPYEMMRRWIVQHKDGTKFEVDVDAGYNGKIQNQPTKVTFFDAVDSIVPTITNSSHQSRNNEEGRGDDEIY